MMNRLLLVLALLLALALGWACHPESENGPNPREPLFDLKNECRNFTTMSGYGFEYATEGTMYAQPRFNPHNASELLYHVYGNGVNRVEIYNLDTKEKRTLTESQSGNLEIDWGSSGWIALSNYKDLYLVREDGSGFHNIEIPTHDPYYSCAEPDFNPDGTVVGFPYGGADGIALYGMYLFYHIDNKSLDTLDSYGSKLNATRPLDWSGLNKMTKAILNEGKTSGIGIGYIDMSDFTEKLVFSNDDGFKRAKSLGSSDISWNTLGDALFLTGGDIICYPLYEYKEIRIKKGCESRYYEDIAISPDDRTIVVERVNVHRPNLSDNILVEQHLLYIMDIDGRNERPLFDD